MLSEYKMKSASQDEINLYCLVGEALCMIQHLEDALSHSILLKKYIKKPYSMPLKNANELLEDCRFYTLGKAIKIAKKECDYSEFLLQDFDGFLLERNWLVHKCMPHNRDDIYSETKKNRLFCRIKNITQKAHTLLKVVEEDLIEFSSSCGLDMSGVQAMMQKYYK